MKYAIAFGILATVLVVNAIALGGWTWLLCWPAISFLIVAIAYAGVGPRLLGKQSDGRIAVWAIAALLPFFALTWGTWHVLRGMSRALPVHEVVPGFWIGRRLLAGELPAGVTLVVDLTAEFREPAGIRTGRAYICLPTLDAMAPRPEALRRAVAQVAEWEGPVFIHCAVGHGRTGMFAAAVLVTRGIAPDVRAAIGLVRSKRPAVRLNALQRRTVEAISVRFGE